MLSRNLWFEIALEVEFLILDLKNSWQLMAISDRVSIFFAAGMLLGALFPWITILEATTQLGLNGGGTLHVALAIYAIWLELKTLKSKKRGDEDYFWQRRKSLLQLLISVVSTLVSIVILAYYASIGIDDQWTTDIRFGFYVSLFSGIGLSMGGLLGFLPQTPLAERQLVANLDARINL